MTSKATAATVTSAGQEEDSLDDTSDMDECSTPLNSRKRVCFFEDSPSNEYDDGSENYIPYSQDVRRHGIDVAWRWDSPKRNNADVAKASRFIESQRRRKLRKKHSPVPVGEKNTDSYESFTKPSTGLLKFQEELENLNKERNQMDSERTCNREEQFCVTDFEDSFPNIPAVDNINKRVMPHLEPLFDELLNDDETDNELLRCSQQVENTLHSIPNPAVCRYSGSTTNCKQLANDSLDEYLSNFPLDNVMSDVRRLNNDVEMRTPNDLQPTKSGTLMSRHKSMPDSPVSFLTNKTPTRSFLRHGSMPANGKEAPAAVSSNFKLSTASSVESVSSSSSYCSDELIAQKREQAKQRLMATKQKQSESKIRNFEALEKYLIYSKKPYHSNN